MFHRTFFLAAIALLLPATVSAMLREPDMALEREPFASVALTAAGAAITDATGEDDLRLFDRGTGGEAPPFVVDLSSVDVVPGPDGWNVTFRFANPLPKEPSYPINFDLFFDDGTARNNAPDGVFRAGTDKAFLLLFGTRTKWHTVTWQYDPASGRWAEITVPVGFTIGEKEVSLRIPASLLPLAPPRGATVRAFALTSLEGNTVVDVAPGAGLPAVRAPKPPRQGISPAFVVLAVFAALLVGSVALWRRKR